MGCCCAVFPFFPYIFWREVSPHAKQKQTESCNPAAARRHHTRRREHTTWYNTPSGSNNSSSVSTYSVVVCCAVRAVLCKDETTIYRVEYLIQYLVSIKLLASTRAGRSSSTIKRGQKHIDWGRFVHISPPRAVAGEEPVVRKHTTNTSYNVVDCRIVLPLVPILIYTDDCCCSVAVHRKWVSQTLCCP